MARLATPVDSNLALGKTVNTTCTLIQAWRAPSKVTESALGKVNKKDHIICIIDQLLIGPSNISFQPCCARKSKAIISDSDREATPIVDEDTVMDSELTLLSMVILSNMVYILQPTLILSLTI